LRNPANKQTNADENITCLAQVNITTGTAGHHVIPHSLSVAITMRLYTLWKTQAWVLLFSCLLTVTVLKRNVIISAADCFQRECVADSMLVLPLTLSSLPKNIRLYRGERESSEFREILSVFLSCSTYLEDVIRSRVACDEDTANRDLKLIEAISAIVEKHQHWRRHVAASFQKLFHGNKLMMCDDVAENIDSS